MLMATLLLASVPTFAAEYWLSAKTTSVLMPDGVTVPMWGFANCTDATYLVCSATSVPGPALDVPAGDASLTVHLQNSNLPEPVSLIINGQGLPVGSVPVWTDGSSGARTTATQRVRSFTHEAAPGGTATYTWNTVKPGTYLYQSGTHPQVQVQMGLYGAMTSDGALSGSYAGAAAYDRALTLLFSEIDPALHTAVSMGDYGTYDINGNPRGPTSTLDYNPKYFLINGNSFQPGDAPLATVNAGENVLLRFINAGLRTRAPMISNGHLSLIAEDGNLYPWGVNPRQQYSVFLPAAKTIDAIYVAQAVNGQDARIAIFDRTLGLINSAQLDGGMMAYLDVKIGNNVPPAITAPSAGVVYYAAQGTTYTQQIVVGNNTPQVAALSSRSSDHDDEHKGKRKKDRHGKHDDEHHDDDGHDGHDSGSGSGQPQAPATRYSLDDYPVGMGVSGTGLVSWVPGKNQVGNHHVTVRVTEPTGLFDTKPFFVEVSSKPNTPPVSGDDIYNITAGGVLNVAAPGVLLNDSDADSDTLTATMFHTAQTVGAVSIESNGAFTYTPSLSNPVVDTFTYRANDGTDMSAVTKVTVNVIANRQPVANKDKAKAKVRHARRNYTPVSIDVLANDFDPDTKLDNGNRIAPATVNIVAQPNKGGVADVDATTGVISYTPRARFKGVEKFTYNVQDTYGAISRTVTVRVRVK